MSAEPDSIAGRVAAVRARIESACTQAGRDPASVRLLAVSKTRSVAEVREALAAGCTEFGENRVDELVTKVGEIGGEQIGWSFIGHLQRNKASHALGAMTELQSLDSPDLAEVLQRRLTAPLPVLVQVNTSGESTKAGLAPDDVLAATATWGTYGMVDLRGLMTIAAPVGPDGDTAHVAAAFDRLRQLQDQLQQRDGGGWGELSMGMSGDLEVAVAHGSTCVRIGTAIFGRRGRPA